jgi:thioredoxin-dependent peroxiredoxin
MNLRQSLGCTLLVAFVALGGGFAGRALAEEVDMAVGSVAPDFSLPDQTGKTQTLSAYRHHWVVLYFYPKDDTPGCTTEACQFRDDYLAVRKLGAEVLGVSVDNHDSHAEFASKYHLPFPLLADTDGKVAKQYGALWSLGFVKFARRHTFIIDPDGRIAKIYRSVDPKTHSRQVIDDLKSLEHVPG